jgi:hypothetical protein
MHVPHMQGTYLRCRRAGRVNVSRSVTESGGLVWSTPKTHERRSVPFPAAITGELPALMVGKNRDELVFTDLRGRRPVR